MKRQEDIDATRERSERMQRQDDIDATREQSERSEGKKITSS
jgi:hypothetical protein